MKKTLTTLAISLVTTTATFAQVGIGTKTPAPSAVLELSSNTKGFLPPRLTTAQRDAISNPAEGLTIFNTDANCVQFYNATAWFDFCEGGLTPGPLTDCPTIPPYLPADQTIVKEVTSATGRIWMDRNLGAYNAARTRNDCYAYGNLYQWGRASDGHEFRSSPQTTNRASTVAPNLGNSWDGRFITVSSMSGDTDWLNFQDDNLWQGVNGVNNPCPAGYRLPSIAELTNEEGVWATKDANGAFGSIGLTVAGLRSTSTGLVSAPGFFGSYVSSNISTAGGDRSNNLFFSINANSTAFNVEYRSNGHTVRCIKN